MNLALIHSVWTVLLFALFIGIVVWAFSSQRKRGFDEAARAPLEEEEFIPAPKFPERPHG